MIVLANLFWLILVALVLIATCLFIIVGLMIREENKSKAKTSSVVKSKATQKCLHSFGFLADDHPRNQPIPDECFHCNLALECINKKVKEDTAQMVEAQD